MSEHLHADVLILGGGLPGLAAACWLAEAGVDVLLVERRARLTDVASARAPGLLHTGIVEHPSRLVRSLGEGEAAALYRFGAEGLDLLSELVPVRRGGVVWAAVDGREPEALEASQAAWARLGVHSALWTGEQVDAATQGTGFGPGLLRPDEGTFAPGLAIEHLAHRARAAGARLHLDERATNLLARGEHLSVQTDRHALTGEIVLLAAESELQQLDLWFEDKLFPVREQALYLPGGPAFEIGLRAGFGYTTAVHDGHGLILAGCRWATPHMEAGERDDAVTTPAVQERLEATARRFFPRHEGPVARRWSWITAHTCDGLPLVGPVPGAPRVVCCAGFSGNEAVLGVRSARAAVDGILTGIAPGVPSSFLPQRFL